MSICATKARASASKSLGDHDLMVASRQTGFGCSGGDTAPCLVQRLDSLLRPVFWRHNTGECQPRSGRRRHTWISFCVHRSMMPSSSSYCCARCNSLHYKVETPRQLGDECSSARSSFEGTAQRNGRDSDRRRAENTVIII